MTAFSLPKDGELFIEQVLQRCKHLISSGIWEGLTEVRLDSWVKNFTDITERYFAACILDTLIYRSEKQTIALMEQLFERVLPDLLRSVPPPDGYPISWLERLRTPLWKGASPLRLVPVIRSDDPPAKSGPALARLYRRHLHLDQAWMIWPWQIARARTVGITQFLFIDDFLGTGDQFADFAQYFNLADVMKGCYGVYAPLVAHASGLREARKLFPELQVVAVEVIDDTYSVFSDNSRCFEDGVNSPLAARAFYDRLVKRANFPIKPEALRGYGKLSLAYAFNHATPDNCLPIIWSEGTDWKPLLDR